MFDFVVRYLGVLKHIPVLSLLFDSMLYLYSVCFNKKIIDCMESIEQEVRQWEGVSVSIHKYGGVQFNFQSKELGHIHGNGLLDILFTTKIKESLIKEGKAEEHHVLKKSGWVSFYIRSEEDRKNALELLQYSFQIHSSGFKP